MDVNLSKVEIRENVKIVSEFVNHCPHCSLSAMLIFRPKTMLFADGEQTAALSASIIHCPTLDSGGQ